jgi:hypothetical protein
MLSLNSFRTRSEHFAGVVARVEQERSPFGYDILQGEDV